MKRFGSSVRVARIDGIEVYLHASLLLSLPMAWVMFRPASVREAVAALLWLVGLAGSVLVHEASHAMAAKWSGAEVQDITLWLLGGLTRFRRGEEKPEQSLLIFAAGPVSNLLLAFGFLAGYIGVLYGTMWLAETTDSFLWGQTLGNLCFSLALSNVSLVVFNLLPIYPLDGGNILRAAVEMRLGKSNADWLTLVVSVPLLLGLIVYSLIYHQYVMFGVSLLMGVALVRRNRSLMERLNLGLNFVLNQPAYYYLRGDYERAAKGFTAEIERQPEKPAGYLTRAACHLSCLQKERALADVERALKLNPGDALGVQMRGELYLLDKNYEAAMAWFEKAGALAPQWAVPHFDRGGALLEQGQFAAALAEFDQAIALPPAFALFYVARSLAHFMLENRQAAHEDQDAALRLSEAEALVMSEINMQIYVERMAWAADYYGRVLKRSPRHALALQGYADACRVNQYFPQAVESYSRAIALNPQEARLYLGRGKARLALNDPQEARSDLLKVLEVTDKGHLRRQAQEVLKGMREQA